MDAKAETKPMGRVTRRDEARIGHHPGAEVGGTVGQASPAMRDAGERGATQGQEGTPATAEAAVAAIVGGRCTGVLGTFHDSRCRPGRSAARQPLCRPQTAAFGTVVA